MPENSVCMLRMWTQRGFKVDQDFSLEANIEGNVQPACVIGRILLDRNDSEVDKIRTLY